MIQTIGIIGTGKFGSLLNQIIPRIFTGSHVIQISRQNNSYEDVKQCDLVIPAVPISDFSVAIKRICPLLKRGSIVMDVCSVKSYPVSIMKRELPSDVQIIATHPMFGPGTVAKLGGDLNGLRIVMENVRTTGASYIDIQKVLRQNGFEIIEMTSENHDRYAAEFHFTAHVIASLMRNTGLTRTPIDTRSAESLFDFAEMVQTDDTTLLKEMYEFNPFCKIQFKKISAAYASICTLLQTT